MIGRAGRDGATADTLLLASPADGASLRRFAVGNVPDASELRRVYRALRETRGAVDPDRLAEAAPERDVRVLVGMLEQAGLVVRGLDEGRRMRVDVREPPTDAAGRVESLLDRARLVADGRADLIISFAESSTCRHAQVAAHFGEALDPPCGACDVCAPRVEHFSVPPDIVWPLPDDVGNAIWRAVSELRWPVGRKSLVAMLRGSLAAPRTTRDSSSFGILAAASEPDVRRWIATLEQAGALVEKITPEGWRVLEADRKVTPPRMAATTPTDVDDALLDRLRSWRSEQARANRVPAYVVFPDATLRDIAALQPRSLSELAGVKGVGPTKLERYGDDVLRVVSAS